MTRYWDYDFEGGVVPGFEAASGAVRQRLQLGVGERLVAPGRSRGRLSAFSL